MTAASRLAASLQAVLDQFTSDSNAAIAVIIDGKEVMAPVTQECNYVLKYRRKVLSEYHNDNPQRSECGS